MVVICALEEVHWMAALELLVLQVNPETTVI